MASITSRATGLAVMVGGCLGIVSGMSGRWVDQSLSILMNALLSFPSIVFALVVLTLMGGGELSLILATGSLALMFWIVFLFAQWAFDESLRVRDYDFLAAQLGKGVMFGELEEALGSRSALIRDRAIELMLFHDGIHSQGITVPAPALRKFLKRV